MTVNFSYPDRGRGLPVDENLILGSFLKAALEATAGLPGGRRLSRTMVGARYDYELLVVGMHSSAAFESSPEWAPELAPLVDALTLEDASDMRLVQRTVGEEEGMRALAGLCPRIADPVLSSIAWTGLARLADDSGRPMTGAALIEPTVTLFTREFDRLRPRRIIALSGWDAFSPFARAIGFDGIGRGGEFAEVVGRADGCLVSVLHKDALFEGATFMREARQWLAPSEMIMSLAQQAEFCRVAGYPWDGHSKEGEFLTNCSFDDRNRPPIGDFFEFVLRAATGNLFMRVSSRWWGAQSFGFDQDGFPVARNLVLRIYPEHN